jgi:serine protease Do
MVGLQPGDLITALGDEDLGGDRSLQTFCDVLRSAGSPASLDLEVFRTTTGEFLTGTVGGSTLTVDPTRPGPTGTNDDGPDGGDVAEVAYEFVADESESIGVQVPVTWDERDGSPNPAFGPSLFASPDLEGFQTTWNVPGLIVEFDPEGGVDDLDSVLDGLLDGECSSAGRIEFETDDGAFVGRSETLEGCGGTDTRLLNIAATRADGRTLVRLQIQMVDDDDVAAADRAVATFDAALPE